MLPAGEAALHGIIHRLRQELQVVTQALCAARAENRRAALHPRDELQVDNSSSRSASSGSEDDDDDATSSSGSSAFAAQGYPSHDRHTSARNAEERRQPTPDRVWRSVGGPPRRAEATRHEALPAAAAAVGLPCRYVPPLDFLPEVFVDEYLDVLVIVDKYAQLFHRLQRSNTNITGDGAAAKDAGYTDAAAARSTIELQAQQLAQLQGLLSRKDEELAETAAQLAQLQKAHTQLQVYGVGSSVATGSPGPRAAARRPADTQASEGGWASDKSSSDGGSPEAAAAARIKARKADTLRFGGGTRRRSPAAAPGRPAAVGPLLSPFPLVQPWHRIVSDD